MIRKSQEIEIANLLNELMFVTKLVQSGKGSDRPPPVLHQFRVMRNLRHGSSHTRQCLHFTGNSIIYLLLPPLSPSQPRVTLLLSHFQYLCAPYLTDEPYAVIKWKVNFYVFPRTDSSSEITTY